MSIQRVLRGVGSAAAGVVLTACVGAEVTPEAAPETAPRLDLRALRVVDLSHAGGVVALENIADLGDLPPVGSWILALPVKIGRGSGGPVRIVALVPEI